MEQVLIKLNHRTQLNFQETVNWRKLRLWFIQVVFALILKWISLFTKLFYLCLISINKTSIWKQTNQFYWIWHTWSSLERFLFCLKGASGSCNKTEQKLIWASMQKSVIIENLSPKKENIFVRLPPPKLFYRLLAARCSY